MHVKAGCTHDIQISTKYYKQRTLNNTTLSVLAVSSTTNDENQRRTNGSLIMIDTPSHRRQWEPEGAGIEVNEEILAAALAVCRRRHVRCLIRDRRRKRMRRDLVF